MSSTQNTIRLSDFLSAFFPTDDEVIHFRAFKPRDVEASAANSPMSFTGTRAKLAEPGFQQMLKSMNATRGMYFIPNAGGDTDLAITRFNAWFCEDDESSIEDQHARLDAAPLPPSVRVTTRKSVHAYWLVNGACDAATWRDIQLRLISHFNGDEKIKNPSRLMRLPHFQHLSVEPGGTPQRVPVTISHFDPDQRFTAAQMQAAFAEPANWDREAITAVQAVNAAMLAEAKQVKHAASYTTWDALNTELRARMTAHPTAKLKRGSVELRGICHNGSGNSGLYLNPISGAYKCMKGCNTSTILQAFGLPEKPEAAPPADITGAATSSTPADPLTGVYDVAALSAAIDKLYADGMLPGVGTGWSNFTDLYTVKPGQLSIWTGMPAHGKSAVLDALMVNIALTEGWHFLICSPENQPLERHCAVLMEIYTGKPFRKGQSSRMTTAELQQAKAWLAKHFTFICPDEASTTVDGILNIIKAVHDRRTVNAVVIDPWNELEHKRPVALNETEYISQSLSKLRRYGRNNKTHMFVVAHPTKIQKDPKTGAYPVPTLYDINGSANWRNKADMGVVVWRDMGTPGSPNEIHVQKVRFRECGQTGVVHLYFDVVSGRFSEDMGKYRLPRARVMERIEEGVARTDAERIARAAVEAIDDAPVALPAPVEPEPAVEAAPAPDEPAAPAGEFWDGVADDETLAALDPVWVGSDSEGEGIPF